jgi:23S rRNA (adenine2503-C2)-methyltransferase
MSPKTPNSATSDAERRVLALGLAAKDFDAIPHAGLTYRDLFLSHQDLPRVLKRWADENDVQLRCLDRVRVEQGKRSQKVLFGLADGHAVESVLIRRHDGYTACVSSQVGCAFACRFCASGQAGLKRNLNAPEIVEQVVRLGSKVNRVVFMGIGEPLNNYDNVLGAIRILRDRNGLRLPTSGITISTIGIPKALTRLREEHLAINLAISLHATTQETRNKLIPGSHKHEIGEVVDRAISWAERHSRTVTFVYLLLAGVNDSRADADRLVRFLSGKPVRVNLMRWNPVDNAAFSRTNDRQMHSFRRQLERACIRVVTRDTQGMDIDAACGQLRLRDAPGWKAAFRLQQQSKGSA